MSKSEIDRLVGDVMSNPTMMQEAMTLKDQAGMEKFISAKGYELTEAEVAEVWAMASKVMAGQGM
ncbi:hypothetical protein [uncultured Pseudodesulfovibrio sp.]|uniref:hypothetical protein n=1 Tax=uncultured Pseudodesulfovibrio sp. TaxID=2035858 RepID=UPI0029C7A089|nr:hypothetical protein [uncultured Pseudodesulfovibrio sp.]